MKIEGTIEHTVKTLRLLTEGSQDVRITYLRAGKVLCAVVSCEGMTDNSLMLDSVYKPLKTVTKWQGRTTQKLIEHIKNERLLFSAKTLASYEDAIEKILSGCACVFADGASCCFALPVPGYAHRAITESYTEENVRSSREGFAEPLSVNVTLVRRRMKTGSLRFEYLKLGSRSNTSVALVYLCDVVSEHTLNKVRACLSKLKIDSVLESGFIEPFLRENRFSLFSGVGYTERPDTLCAKIGEGRIGILVDGTPFALTVPHLFIENFQSFDDYSQKAYYASFIRIVKLVSFVISIFLPGIYVALALHAPELLAFGMLKNLIASEQSVALPIVAEALFIQLVYEIVREAGLRLPRPVGHAVSLIGALVVGETAISAGLAGAPMVMIAALTAVCSFTIPKLYQPSAVLRFGFILLGGIFGPLGIVAGGCFLGLDISSVNVFGTPYLAPLSPASRWVFDDAVIRRSWRKLADNGFLVSKLPKGGKRK